MDSHANQYRPDLPPPPPAHHAQPSHPQAEQYQQQSFATSSHHQQTQQHQEQQQQQQRNQAQHNPQSSQSSSKRGFSFHSDKARKNSQDKGHLSATAAEKESKRIRSKADPSLAINEAEPAEIAAMSETSLAPLRSIAHKDANGNPIADPDKSNPTRNRWERPLDTIRSFEAAIEGGYSRKSMTRADTDSVANWNRRSSYHPGGANGHNRPDSFYGGSRPVSTFRPDVNHYDYNGQGTARSSVYEVHGYNGGHQGGHGYANGRQRQPRMYSEPSNYNNPRGRDSNGYHLSHQDRSYETVTSAATSGSSDPAGYQTDPTSSDNSSIERRSPAKRPEPVNDYGIGFSQSQNYQDPSFSVGVGQSGHHPLPQTPAGVSYDARNNAVPRKEAPTLLKRQPTQQSVATEKRKSWFSRRFSKNA
jgi:hypothetical protein